MMGVSDKAQVLDYLQLMRAPAVFTALSNILAAHLILTQGIVIWSSLLLLMGATAALYTGGMVLNDWFDYKTDLTTRPHRPLPSGHIKRSTALILGLELLVIGIGLAAYAGLQSMYLAILIALLVLLYDGLLSDNLLGSLNMGACRYFNWLLGFSILPLSGGQLIIALPVFIYITALTLLSREEETAKHRWLLVLAAGGIAAAILSIPFIMPDGVLDNPWPGLFAVLLLVLFARQFLKTFRNFTPDQVQATVKLLIFSIIPLDALIVLAFGPWWGGLAVVCLLLPGRLLARFMYIT